MKRSLKLLFPGKKAPVLYIMLGNFGNDEQHLIIYPESPNM